MLRAMESTEPCSGTDNFGGVTPAASLHGVLVDGDAVCLAGREGLLEENIGDGVGQFRPGELHGIILPLNPDRRRGVY